MAIRGLLSGRDMLIGMRCVLGAERKRVCAFKQAFFRATTSSSLIAASVAGVSSFVNRRCSLTVVLRMALI